MASLISLVGQANGMILQADDLADGEREFVLQLQAQQFYNLAEQFCTRRSENSRTPEARAAWQSMLADCRERHAWSLREPGRSQLLAHAAESITQFIRKESLSAESDLLLRVRQIELLSTIVRIDAACHDFGPKTAPHSLATQASNEGLQLAEAMLEQIELIRRNIESGVAREARDRVRYVTAELLLLQSRQNSADEALRSRAIAAAEQLMKSSGDDVFRFKARSLLAESLLDSSDFKGFDLSLVSLTSMSEKQIQRMAVAALRIRGLLRREQPSEALQLSLNLEKQSLRSEELSTLRLASLLHLFELLHKLEAPELRRTTADEFHLLNHRLNLVTAGVWRECCERIALRFSHVEKFGPEAATAIESVTDLIAAGDLAAARRALLEMRSSFQRNSPQIAGTLSMQSGDLAIRLSDWQAAEADLAFAVDSFKTTENRDQEAASDLLRIYAMGRHWDTEHSSDIEVRNPLEAAYSAALKQHIAEYSGLKTSTKAREWHAMLLRATNPVTAADELLTLVDGDSEGDLILLVKSGEILTEAAFGPLVKGEHPDPGRLTAEITVWAQHADTTLAGNRAAETTTGSDTRLYQVLKIQQLVFSLKRRWLAQDDWKNLATEARQHVDAIAALDLMGEKDEADGNVVDEDMDESSVGFSAEVQAQFHVAKSNGYAILALAACRQLLGPDAIQESRSLLIQQTPERRRQIVGLLLYQASETHVPVPGDPQLGFLALDLLHEEKSVAMTINQRLAQLPVLLIASKIADDFQQFDTVVGDLTTLPLTDLQLQTMASILQQRFEMKTPDGTQIESVRQFWRSVLERSRSGTDQWLEASLQLATIAVQENKSQEADKVLNVINALHPKWGTPERQKRAAALKARLESAK